MKFQTSSEFLVELVPILPESRISIFKKMLKAFETMRAGGLDLYNACIKDLYSECTDNFEIPHHTPTSEAKEAIQENPPASFIKNLKFLYLQSRRLKKLDMNFATLSVALTASRLYSSEAKLAPKQWLQDLLSPMGQTSGNFLIPNMLNTSQRLLVFDPVWSSKMRSDFEALNRQHIFVVDAGFASFFLMINHPLRFILAGLKSAITVLISLPDFRTGIKLGLVQFFAEAFEKVQTKSPTYELLLLTCNNFFTETLRWNGLVSAKCERVLEVLHGIPTRDLEIYNESMGTVLQVAGLTNKVLFVPQVPLKLKAPYEKHLMGEGKLGINTYLNFKKLRAEVIKSLWSSQNPWQGNTTNEPVITFLGGTGHTENFYTSDAFQVELNILKFVSRWFRKKNRPVKLLYTPHPANRNQWLKESELLSRWDTTVFDNTPLTWMISDMSLAIFSSAVFEAGYFQSTAFTPIKTKHRVFSKNILNLIRHPEDQESWQQALQNILDQQFLNPEQKGLDQKIKERPQLLTFRGGDSAPSLVDFSAQ